MSEVTVDSDSYLMHFGKFATTAIVSYFAVNFFFKKYQELFVDRTTNKLAYEKLKKVGLDVGNKLNTHELKIAANLIVPEEINGSWKNIAGLENIKKELNQSVIFPMKNRNLLKESGLLKPPKGILLYGPPGCGKTMIAKATAKEANVSFINLDISTLTDKLYGESPKLATAIFSLAEKIQPCIIFIDEIDSLLRSRSSSDHEATAQLKSIFLSKWDGLTTDKNIDIIIMGATNRPDDIDPAIARRMPKKYHIKLPEKEQRVSILKLQLESEEHDLNDKVIAKLADYTDGFSSNDLEELCRDAAGLRLEELTLDDSENL
ncbi:hypothetical protein M8J76_007252 [Diaphorina citri]|nr:hypothetical protein M8J76_007252 [Diaphorina citri]